MQTSSRPRHRVWTTTLLAALSGALLAAEPAAQPKPAEEAVTLDKFEVTGSHLSTPAGLAPVTTISADEIRRSGVDTNVLDLLRKQMPAFSGAGNMGTTNASVNATSTLGGSRLALHNMPTLVLLNGRRVATNGANARGGSSYVDVSQFPLAAVERIEVLADGASAVYGSDALGGVVNIILKKSYTGSEIGARYAVASRDGDYSEESAWVTAGAREGSISVLASGSYSKSSPLMQSDRPFSSVANSSSYSGVVGSAMLAPGVNSPADRVPVGPSGAAANIGALIANGTYVSGVAPLNLADYVTLLAGQEKRSGYLSVSGDLLSKRLQFFADVLYSETDTRSQLGAQNVTFNGTGTNPQLPPDNSPYNPFAGVGAAAVFRYVPAPRLYRNESDLFRFTAGLKGEISEKWDWEAAYTRNDNRLVARVHNVLFGPNLDLAVAGGYDAAGNAVVGGAYSRVYKDFTAPAVPSGLSSAQAAAWLAAQRTTDNTTLQPALDPYASSAGINPASLANVLGVARSDFKSRLNSLDFVVRGRVAQLPAGPLAVAVGGDHRKESLVGSPDENSRSTGAINSRWVGASYFDPFNRSRDVTSGYAELGVPVAGPSWKLPGVASLDLGLAYRVEHYSDAGNSNAPRISVRWRPVDEQFTVRYSYARAFAAPKLYDLFGPVTEARSTNLGPIFSLPGTGPWQATVSRGSNPDLEPTTSTSHSAGFIFRPRQVKGLVFSVDYLEVKLENMLGTVGSTAILQSVNEFGLASPYAGQVAFNNYHGKPGSTGITAPGQIRQFLLDNPASAANSIYVSDTSVNISAARLRAVDFAVEYERELKDESVLSFGSRATWFVDDCIQVLPTEPYYEYAGYMTSTEGTMPSIRFHSTLGWRKYAWDVELGHNYIPSVDDIGTGGSTFARSTSMRAMHIDSYMTWDLAIGYTFEFFRRGERRVPLRIALGVNNLSDELPPVSTQAFASPNYPAGDTATYGALGRLFYVSADVKF